MSRWLVVLTLVTGCGFSLSGPDPQRPREQMPKCDTGKGAVVVDGLMATLASVVALALVGADEPAGALIPGGIAVAYIGGAVHGSRAVDECRAAMNDWQGAVAARETLREAAPPGPDIEREVEQRPIPQPPVQQAPVPPPPVETAPPPKKRVKQPKPAPTEDEWSDFWREVQ